MCSAQCLHFNIAMGLYTYVGLQSHRETTVRPCKLNIRFLVQTQMKRRQGTRLFIYLFFFGGGGGGGGRGGGEGGEAG